MLLAAWALLAVLQADAGTRVVVVQETSSDSCLRDGQGHAIGNLFAFDEQGRLLDRVLLYDQRGRPISSLCPETVPGPDGRPLRTTYARDVNGSVVPNVFPRVQERIDDEAGTSHGGQPPVTAAGSTRRVPPPAVVIPRLAPPTTAAQPTPTTAPQDAAPQPPTTAPQHADTQPPLPATTLPHPSP